MGSEGASVSSTPTMEQTDGSADAGAQADAGDEVAGAGVTTRPIR